MNHLFRTIEQKCIGVYGGKCHKTNTDESLMHRYKLEVKLGMVVDAEASSGHFLETLITMGNNMVNLYILAHSVLPYMQFVFLKKILFFSTTITPFHATVNVQEWLEHQEEHFTGFQIQRTSIWLSNSPNFIQSIICEITSCPEANVNGTIIGLDEYPSVNTFQHINCWTANTFQCKPCKHYPILSIPHSAIPSAQGGR